MLGKPHIDLSNTQNVPGHRLAPADKLSLAEQAYVALRNEIIYAGLKPDEIVTESELAVRLGFSKTPVRDALRALVKDGFITALPRKGYVVRAIGINDIKEVLQLRMILEPAIAADAARQITADDLEQLNELLALQRSESSIDKMTNTARDFHIKIIQVSQNVRAQKMLVPLFDETTRMHHVVPQTAEFLHSDEEICGHEKILAAFAEHDEAAAEEAMRDHIEAVRQTMIRGLIG